MIPLRDSEHSGRFPLVTTLLIVANVLVFLVEWSHLNIDLFINTYGFVPSSFSFLNFGSYVPLVTSQFLHAGFTHILSNMWFLWVFGDNVEARMGSIRFLVFYLIGGVFAALFQYFVDTSSVIPMVGASGAVAAVLGAYLKLLPHARIDSIIPVGFVITRVRIAAPIMLGWWFITQLFNGVASLALVTASMGGVAFFAHIGGFVYGYLVSRR